MANGLFRFRFHPDDHERYGSDWYVYDHAQIARIRGKELNTIEAELRRELGIDGINEMVLRLAKSAPAGALLAASWLALRQSGRVVDLADYDPLVSLMEFEIVPEGDAGPPAGSAGSTSSPSTRRSKRS